MEWMDNYLQEVAIRRTSNRGILTRRFSSQQLVRFHRKEEKSFGFIKHGSGTAYVSLTSIGDDWHQPNHFDLLWNHVVSQKMWSYCLCPYCKCVCNVLSGTLIVLQILAVPISIVEVFCPLLPIVFWLVWNYSGFLLFPKYSPINTKMGFRSFLNHPCFSLTMSYHVLPCLTMSYHVLPCLTMSYHVLPCLTMSYPHFQLRDTTRKVQCLQLLCRCIPAASSWAVIAWADGPDGPGKWGYPWSANGCVWKWLVPLKPMVLLIIIPIKWLFHWENTQHFQTNPNDLRQNMSLFVAHFSIGDR